MVFRERVGWNELAVLTRPRGRLVGPAIDVIAHLLDD